MDWLAEQGQLDRPFGSWADHLAAAFVQLEPRKLGDQPFRGAITRTNRKRSRFPALLLRCATRRIAKLAI